MKINHNKADNRQRLGQVTFGSLFEYKNVLYLLTDTNLGPDLVKAVEIEHGQCHDFPVSLEVTVHPDASINININIDK